MVHDIPRSPRAYPGAFALGLENGVDVEMTVTQHTALYSFYLADNDSSVSPMMLLDLTDLQDSWQNASISVDP